jgi:SAM-dependent MidA family methyltransferase
VIDPTTNELAIAAENAALKAAITERVEREGPITFRDYMNMALYHPEHGYYSSDRPKMGREGDYLTSPQVHSVFGYMLAKQLWQVWALMNRPASFDIVEMGAGRGILCRDILSWAREQAPDFYGAIAYSLVERSDALRAEAKRMLEDAGWSPDKVGWTEGVSGDITGCIISNELVDSFPVHRVTVENGELREIYADWHDDKLVDMAAQPSTPELREYFERLELWPGEGSQAEVNLEAPHWIAEVGQALQRGVVLTFDYGYEAADLYAPWRGDGTLQCFYRHTVNSDPFARLGYQDMTAHVDFTTLAEEGRRWGLEPLDLISQSQFLTALGVGGGLSPTAGERDSGLQEYYERRRAIFTLIDPHRLGRIKVLVQHKALPQPADLWCLQPPDIQSP